MSTPVVPARRRLDGIDVVRGLIMILMALDHTRDFFGSPVAVTATLPLFFTRWITHFCAPTFALLTGTSARLALARKGCAGLSRFLLTRGLWLVLLEVTVVRCLVYQFNVDYHTTLLLVLWSLGCSMILLAALVWLPDWAIAALAVVLIAGHNLLDGLRVASPLWSLVHRQGFLLNTPEHTVFVAYPLVPWIAVVALGYVLGRVYSWVPTLRQAFLFPTGLMLTLAFVALRLLNLYGDPAKWQHGDTFGRTLISFLNVTKNPPSLIFLLMTLGPALILLSLFDSGAPKWMQPAVIIGRVPLFYYIGHFFLLHAAAVVICLVINGSAHWMFASPDLGNYPFTQPPGWGSGLVTVYIMWAVVVMTMYGACRWFAALKQRRRDWWLSYL